MQHSKATVDLLRTAQDALARSGGLLRYAVQHCAVLRCAPHQARQRAVVGCRTALGWGCGSLGLLLECPGISQLPRLADSCDPALLNPAMALLHSAGRRAGKTLQHCMLLLGHELLEAGDAAAAERLLTQVAGKWEWVCWKHWCG